MKNLYKVQNLNQRTIKKKPCTLQIFYMVSWTMDENKKVNSLIIQI